MTRILRMCVLLTITETLMTMAFRYTPATIIKDVEMLTFEGWVLETWHWPTGLKII